MTAYSINQMDLVLAILKEVARQYPKSTPLPRQYNAIVDAANSVVHEFSIGEIKSKKGEGIEAWRKTDQVGSSSDFMASRLSGKGVRGYAHPKDGADFGRCLTLLDAAPELRDQLRFMANASPQWAVLVAHWTELEALYTDGKMSKLYEQIQALYDKLEEKKHA